MRVTLGELAVFKGGSVFPREEQGGSVRDLPFAKVSDLARTLGERDIDDAAEWISEEQRIRLHPAVAAKNDVLFAKIGEGLKSERFRLARRDIAFDNNMMVAKPKDSCYGLFLFYLLRTLNISQYANGSALPYLTQGKLSGIPVEVPSLPEQRAIADVLGALDDKIAANHSLATVVDNLVRVQYMGFSSERSYSIEDIAENIRIQANPNSHVMDYIGLEHIPRRHMWLGDWGDSSGVASAKSEFRSGDVLFGKLRPYFHKVVSAPVDGISSTDILVVRARCAELQGLVLAALSADETISRCNAFAAGTKMPRVSWKDLASCPVRWVDDATMTSFSRMVTDLRDRVDAAYAESRTLASLRDTLLPALMNGTLRVKDAEKQVGEVL